MVADRAEQQQSFTSTMTPCATKLFYPKEKPSPAYSRRKALDLAILWINDNCFPSSRPLIIIDSQSLCKALVGFNELVDALRSQLSYYTATISIQWFPGHCGIPGNELADQAANDTRTVSGPHMSKTYTRYCLSSIETS